MAGSLRRRLLWAAAAWIALALALAAWALTLLFRAHVEDELASRMRGHLDELTAAVTRPPGGAWALAREPGDPAFRQPFSGFYWIVETPGAPLRSRSLWDHALALPASGAARLETAGPRGEPLVWWARTVQPPGAEAPLRVAVGADVSRLDALTRSFARALAASLAVLGAVLMAAAALQVRLGLAPLARLGEALGALRADRSQRVPGRWPAEVQPLVADLNAVLDANAAILERARTQSGNLAHALKTPLAVIGNAAAALPPAEAALIGEQAERMRRTVELHLVRARAAAIAHTRGPGTPLRAALDAVLRSLARLHADKGLAFEVRGETTAPFRGELQDLQEMLGNLLDNAAQWARRRVEVTLAEQGDRLLVTIDDDGPGIPAAERARVLQRGERLDEQPAGAGLGLAIVDDLARLYGGRLALADSPLGGLRAALELPAAPSFETMLKE